jgi:hypothetical protein
LAQWIVPIATAVVSAIGALVSVWYGRRTVMLERWATAEDLATRFREPLLQAVFNLETRIYNIAELNFFGRFLAPDSTEDEREYAVLNTCYLFAQYFCWVEIIRRESQFLDPRSVERNRAIAHCLEAVRDTFSDSINLTDPAFRLFRGEQRALGEVMLVPVADRTPSAPKWECLGYAGFIRAIEDKQTCRWFGRLREDIMLAAGGEGSCPARLVHVQRGLLDIVDALDPDAVRVPASLRQRLQPPGRDRTTTQDTE